VRPPDKKPQMLAASCRRIFLSPLELTLAEIHEKKKWRASRAVSFSQKRFAQSV
jgi:hypothetical protein